MLTIFTIPKAFEGHSGTIQWNALRSWTLLAPRCEVVLCGDDPGVAEAAAAFGVRHLPEIACTDYGTPLLDDAFAKVAAVAAYPTLCYVNADIILLDDLLDAVRRVRFPEFLLVGRRRNVDIDHRWDFDADDGHDRLVRFVAETGELAPPDAIDYFVFTPNGRLENLPPFAVGRPGWDNWFIFNARQAGTPVVDATEVVTAVHQNHDYGHIPKKSGKRWAGPEATQNRELLAASGGGAVQPFSVWDATHRLTADALKPALSGEYLRRRVRSLAALHPTLRPLAPALHRLSNAPRWLARRLRPNGRAAEVVPSNSE